MTLPIYYHPQRDVDREKANLNNFLQSVLKEVRNHRAAWPFTDPVDTDEVTDYLDVVSDPIGEYRR